MLHRANSLTKFALLVAMFLAATALSSCKSSKKNSGGIGGTLDEYVAALQRCGVLSAGRVPDGFLEAPEVDATQRACISGCIAKASCDEVTDSFCGDGGELENCFDACTRFTCADGSTVRLEDRCDAEPDCPGGDDETGCAGVLFQCADGDTIPQYYVCDDSTDCSDGSDEVNCPVFTCNNGDTIPPDYKCDGESDCADDSDETGCPTFTCPDSSKISQSLVCNGADDCEGGADELGCAEVTCPDPFGE
ncbi:MAG: LDL receptor domain-containing protein [Myxococcota bacterium]